MRGLIVINGEPFPTDIEVAEVSFQKYEDYDLAVIITIPEEQKAEIESRAQALTGETPSKVGVVPSAVQLPTKLFDVVPEEDLLNIRGTVKSPAIFKSAIDITEAIDKIPVESADVNLLETASAFTEAYRDLLAKELLAISDYLQKGQKPAVEFVIQAGPSISFIDGSEKRQDFKLIETIYVFKSADEITK